MAAWFYVQVTDVTAPREYIEDSNLRFFQLFVVWFFFLHYFVEQYNKLLYSHYRAHIFALHRLVIISLFRYNLQCVLFLSWNRLVHGTPTNCHIHVIVRHFIISISRTLQRTKFWRSDKDIRRSLMMDCVSRSLPLYSTSNSRSRDISPCNLLICASCISFWASLIINTINNNVMIAIDVITHP